MFSPSPIATPAKAVGPYYWPTSGWQFSTPEKQGMDSGILATMLEEIQKQDYNIHAIFLVRNGYVVLDTVYFPYPEDRMFNVFSVTKSVNAALIGIAIDQGYIKDVNAPVLSFFPNRKINLLDEEKTAISIQDLLTMRSGLRCRDSYLYGWQGLREMQASEDWVQFMLDLPMVDAPGERFEYCNGASFLLSAILQEVTGQSAVAFATENLFAPLGIEQVVWAKSPQGIHTGWSDMQLTPEDMAKFGYLFINKGRWDGEQIVSERWVLSSWRAHAFPHTIADAYGYQWWIDESGYYIAAGFAGQFIFVLPQHNMVVVFTSGLSQEDFLVPRNLLKDFIIPSIQSSNSLPPNSAAIAKLTELTVSNANPPQIIEMKPIPAAASRISGHTFFFNQNQLNLREFTFTFEDNSTFFNLIFGEKNITVEVGMDGVPRITTSEGYPRAYKGHWIDDLTFELNYEIVGYSENGQWLFTFQEDHVIVQFHEETTDTILVEIARLKY